jgi:ABC-type transport system substrate-binding protein
VASRARIVAAACVLLLLAVVVLSLASCGSSSSSTVGSPAVSASPKSGGTLTLAADLAPSNLNPWESWDSANYVVDWQIFEAPYALQLVPGTNEVKMVPVLAREMPTMSADGKSFTFQLKSGIKFQPPVNREVTADDLKYSVETMLSDPLCPGTWYFANIVGVNEFMAKKARHVTGIKVLDKYTVEVDLTKPMLSSTFPFETQFSMIMPKEWVQKWGKDLSYHPLGTGPYTLDSWTEGREIVLKKNPNYWGTANVDTYVLKFAVSPTTQVMMVKSGAADFMWSNIPAADMASVKADAKWKDHIVTRPGVGVFSLFIKTNMKPLDNVDVRQAIAWAIDREKLCKLQAGEAIPAGQQVPKGMNVWEPDAAYVGYDPAKAKDLLAKAGYPNGFTSTLWCTPNEPLPTLFQSIQSDLAAVGIKADLKTMSEEAFLFTCTKPGKMPMGFQGWVMDIPDPFDWYEGYVTKAGIYAGGWNAALFTDPQIDAALADAQAEMDPTTRIEKFRGVNKMVMAAMPYVPLYQEAYAQLVNPSVGGYYQHPFMVFVFKDYWRN